VNINFQLQLYFPSIKQPTPKNQCVGLESTIEAEAVSRWQCEACCEQRGTPEGLAAEVARAQSLGVHKLVNWKRSVMGFVVSIFIVDDVVVYRNVC
jgi:hypothetical protein